MFALQITSCHTLKSGRMISGTSASYSRISSEHRARRSATGAARVSCGKDADARAPSADELALPAVCRGRHSSLVIVLALPAICSGKAELVGEHVFPPGRQITFVFVPVLPFVAGRQNSFLSMLALPALCGREARLVGACGCSRALSRRRALAGVRSVPSANNVAQILRSSCSVTGDLTE